ncbi:hypothetical protein ACG02S_23145 [Roseateles sp. DC23W]|uniref:Uncharacterized protein n=1 Tax=Pelomonas dachongensis TaxID=3299029 RepID=A0ABW7ETP0_9BURK
MIALHPCLGGRPLRHECDATLLANAGLYRTWPRSVRVSRLMAPYGPKGSAEVVTLGGARYALGRRLPGLCEDRLKALRPEVVAWLRRVRVL